MKEFNLSKLRYGNIHTKQDFYLDEDIKDFIKRLKKWLRECPFGSININCVLFEIDKLAGDDLKC